MAKLKDGNENINEENKKILQNDALKRENQKEIKIEKINLFNDENKIRKEIIDMKEDKKENQNKKEDENENIKIIEKRKNDDTMSNKININKNIRFKNK